MSCVSVDHEVKVNHFSIDDSPQIDAKFFQSLKLTTDSITDKFISIGTLSIHRSTGIETIATMTVLIAATKILQSFG